MTTEIVLRSSPATTLISHLSMYGLSAILEDAGFTVRLSWSKSMTPRPALHVEASEEDIGNVVRIHALSHTVSGSLCSQTSSPDMSPRITAIPVENWEIFKAQRHEVIDRYRDSLLETRFLGGLGEPAHWPTSGKEGDKGQDRGASMLEMVPRNRGSSLFPQRMLPLAKIVSECSAAQIVTRLTGDVVVDEMQTKSKNPYSASGLGPDITTDNVLAWCAMWGLSLLPVTHQVNDFSDTSATFRPTRSTKGIAVFPVWYAPFTLAKVRSVLTSYDLVVTASDNSDRLAACLRLASRGVDGVIVFSFVDRDPDNKNSSRWGAQSGQPLLIGSH